MLDLASSNELEVLLWAAVCPPPVTLVLPVSKALMLSITLAGGLLLISL